MAYFPHAYQKLLVGVNGFTSVPGHSVTLETQAGKVAVVNSKDNLIQNLAVAPAGGISQFYLAQGSFHTTDKLGPFHGGYKESVKTKGINPRYVSAFYVTEPTDAVNQIISVGCASPCDFLCNQTYRLRVDIKGSPALRLLTHNAYKTLDAFTGCCADGVTTSLVDPALVYELWADELTNDPILSKFVEAKVKYVLNGAATFTKPAGWAAALASAKYAQLILEGAYVDTKFGDCSFSPRDHFELEPISIYASATDDKGDPCASDCFCVAEVQEGYQGTGYGEPLVRELILSKRYAQEPWQDDVRLREVLDDTTLSELNRSNKYFVYHLLHSVPRKSNPSGTMDSDQYLIKIVVNERNADFEDYINALLTGVNSEVEFSSSVIPAATTTTSTTLTE